MIAVIASLVAVALAFLAGRQWDEMPQDPDPDPEEDTFEDLGANDAKKDPE